MSMASKVMKLIFAVLDVSFNSGHHTVIIRRQFLYIFIAPTTDRRVCVTIRCGSRQSKRSLDEFAGRSLDPVVDRWSRSNICQVESMEKSSTSRSSRVDFSTSRIDRLADD